MNKTTLGLTLLAVAALSGTAVGLGVTYHQQIGSAVGSFLNRHPAAAHTGTLYTCAMHPQVIRDHPGNCPICGMPLEIAHGHAGADGTVVIDPVVIQNMAVRVAPVTQGMLTSTIRATGTLVEEEQNHIEINLRVSGWIQKLYANKDGMIVAKGDSLFDLFSPELTSASDELIAARKSLESADTEPVLKNSAQAILAAARRKLSLWGLTEDQIDAIAKLDKAPQTITFFSPFHGHITEKMVVEGAAVKAGDRIMKIADRSSMWLELSVYEPQLRHLEVGAPVHITLAAVPGIIEGKIDFIYPHLDMMARTAKLRVVLPNADHALREGMYAEADIDTPPGDPVLMVPREAIIDSGIRQVVFVAEPEGHFSPRTVTVGITGHMATEGNSAPTGDNMVAILSGLKGDETVVTSGQFLIDAESRMQESLQKYLTDRELIAKKAPATGPALPPDKNIDTLAASYLHLVTYFSTHDAAAPDTDITPIIDAAKTLAAEAPDPAIKSLAEDAAQSAAALTTQPLDTQRQQLKKLSTTLLALLDKIPPSPSTIPVLYEFHCPMSKADWAQSSPAMVNPYLADMRDCGSLTKTLGKPQGGAPQGGAPQGGAQ